MKFANINFDELEEKIFDKLVYALSQIKNIDKDVKRISAFETKIKNFKIK